MIPLSSSARATIQRSERFSETPPRTPSTRTELLFTRTTVLAAAASSYFSSRFYFRPDCRCGTKYKREQTLKSFSVDGSFVCATEDVLFAERRDGRRCRCCTRCAPRKRHEAYSLSAGRFSCRAPSACARVRESACARVRVRTAAARSARLIPMTLKERVVFDLNGSFRHTQKEKDAKVLDRA